MASDASVIKAVRLVNFRSFKDVTFEFSNFSTLVGLNFAGKTNLWRALRIVLFHKNFSKNCIRRGQDRAFVKVMGVDGWSIKRVCTRVDQSVTIVRSDGTKTTRSEE